VVVEGKQVDPPVGQPLADFVFGIEIVGLLPQMVAGIGGELSIASSNCRALSPLRKPGSQDQVVA
jgi:hypothetical protein